MAVDYDVAVIGSGIGGLCAALSVARAGHSVIVLEAGKQYGGYINPFARKHFHFDPGVHYVGELGPGQGFRNMLERMGIDDVDYIELDPDGFDRYVFPNYEVSNCRGLDRFRNRLINDFPRDADGIQRLFRIIEDLADARRALMRAKTPFDRAWAMIRGHRIFRWRNATLSQMLSHFLSDETLRAAVAAPVGDLGLPPSRVSALAHLGVLSHYSGGAFMPKGGCGKLRDAFVRALQGHGAEMRRNARVASIITQGGRARGVQLADGQTITADCVISNADVGQTYQMLPRDQVPDKIHRRVLASRRSMASFCIFAGLHPEADTSAVGAANIWHYPSTDIEACYRAGLGGPASPDSGFFVSVPTNKDPDGGLAPAGHHGLQIVGLTRSQDFKPWFEEPVMRRSDAYKQLKRSLAEPFLSAAERYIPDLRQHTQVLEVSTPATNWSFTLSPEGAIYGPEHSPEQMGSKRIGMLAGMDGLYLCGAAVISCGVYPCAVSGRIAGKLAVKDLKARRDVAVRGASLGARVA